MEGAIYMSLEHTFREIMGSIFRVTCSCGECLILTTVEAHDPCPKCGEKYKDITNEG